jgi:hypothetical protein
MHPIIFPFILFSETDAAAESIQVKTEPSSVQSKAVMPLPVNSNPNSEVKELRIVVQEVAGGGQKPAIKVEQSELDRRYDEFEAIQRELNSYSKDTNGSPGEDPSNSELGLDDDDLHAQVQSAIDSILNLQRSDDLLPVVGAANGPVAAARRAAASNGETDRHHRHLSSLLDDDDDEEVGPAGDSALDEAVRSILTS